MRMGLKMERHNPDLARLFASLLFFNFAAGVPAYFTFWLPAFRFRLAFSFIQWRSNSLEGRWRQF